MPNTVVAQMVCTVLGFLCCLFIEKTEAGRHRCTFARLDLLLLFQQKSPLQPPPPAEPDSYPLKKKEKGMRGAQNIHFDALPRRA